MQPYFFPYLGYFSLIKYVDKFIFFDTPQYIHHGWINRNRIIKQNGCDTYIIVPLKKAPRETPIYNMIIDSQSNWKTKIYGQLSVYKKKAPFYKRTLDIVNQILESESYGESLAKLNIYSTVEICKLLQIGQNYGIYSQMNLEIDKVNAPDEWALNITKALNFDTYVNAPGGKAFFCTEKYKKHNIHLEFLEINPKPYIQKIGHFIPNLSIIDVLMYCDIPEILEMLDDFTIF